MLLRGFKSIWVGLITVGCLVGTGCSSFRVPDGDDFGAQKSRLIDMRDSDLETIVTESIEDVSPVEEADGLVEQEADVLSDMPVSYRGVDRSPVEMKPQRAKLQSDLVPLQAAGANAEQGEKERIIILKAMSANRSTLTEMDESSDNPAFGYEEMKNEIAAPKEVSNQLVPLPLNPENSSVYSNFQPGKLVCGADCDCQACRTAVEVSVDSAESEKLELLPDSTPANSEVLSNAPVVSEETEVAEEIVAAEETEVAEEIVAAGETEVAEEIVAAGEVEIGAIATSNNQFEPGQSETVESSSAKDDISSELPVESAISESQAPPAETGGLIATETAQPAASVNTTALPWDAQLQATITAFENQIVELGLNDYRRPKLQQSLAILHALDERLASGRIALEQSKHQQYWQHQLTVILNMLHAATTSEEGGRQNVSVAVDHLKSAVIELQQLSDLFIARVELCSEVSGYGQFVPMQLSDFRPESKTLVYCEIENFLPVAEMIEDRPMFETRLECRLEILGPDDAVAQAVDFPVVQDVAANRRRDFYLHLPLTLDDLPAGSYQLRLDVKDLGSGKSASRFLPDSLIVK